MLCLHLMIKSDYYKVIWSTMISVQFNQYIYYEIQFA